MPFSGVGRLDGRLREVGVHLNLVDGGNNVRGREQLLKVMGHEVADANRPHEAIREQGLQCLVRGSCVDVPVAVAGLRREEVAMLAGRSVDYYIRMERGNLSGASDSVLEALGRGPEARRRRDSALVRHFPRRRQPPAGTSEKQPADCTAQRFTFLNPNGSGPRTTSSRSCAPRHGKNLHDKRRH